MILTQKTRGIYFGLLLIFSVLALVYFKNILLPLAYAYTFAVFTFPFYKVMENYKIPRGFSIPLMAIAYLLLSIGGIYMVSYSVQEGVEFIESRELELLAVRDSFFDLLKKINLKEYFIAEKGMERLMSIIQYFSFSVFNYFSLYVLSFLYFIFIYLAPNRLIYKYVDYGRLGQKIRTYIKYKFFFSTITALAVSFVLMAFSIQRWQAISIIVFVLNFIPNIGSIIATLLPVPIYYLSYGLGVEFWFLLVFTSSLQFLIGNMVEPRIMGNMLNVPAIFVIFALLFWGKVWGALGVFFAVPSLIAIYYLLPRIKKYLS